MTTFLRKCSFLDVRYRTMSTITEEEKEEIFKEMVEQSKRLFRSSTSSISASPSDSEQQSEPQPTVKKSRSSLGALLLKSSGAQSGSTSVVMAVNHKQRSRLELSQYEAVVSVSPDDSPLDFWRDNRAVFPLLSQVACKYLCSCATSCSSERFFSLTGHIVSKKRSSYNPEMINTLAFLAFNMKKCKLSSS